MFSQFLPSREDPILYADMTTSGPVHSHAWEMKLLDASCFSRFTFIIGSWVPNLSGIKFERLISPPRTRKGADEELCAGRGEWGAGSLWPDHLCSLWEDRLWTGPLPHPQWPLRSRSPGWRTFTVYMCIYVYVHTRTYTCIYTYIYIYANGYFLYIYIWI